MQSAVEHTAKLQALDEGTRLWVQGLLDRVAQQSAVIERQGQELVFSKAKNEKLNFELALLKRMKFAAKSEALNDGQRNLLEDDADEDIAAVEQEIVNLEDAQPNKSERKQPKRQSLPADLPREEFHHEPESTTCDCGEPMKRIGEDVAEKLDYVAGMFTVQRHVRGKWACACCERITQAPVEPHIIDKGIPTEGLLAQVLVAKYAGHLPLYRQEAIFGRSGLAIPRSTLAAWVGQCGVQLQPVVHALKAEILDTTIVHADETPVQMLKPANGKTHRAYLWAYAPGEHEGIKGVVYDFTESRAGKHAQGFLKNWSGALLVDDFAGYKQLFNEQITELGCWAHARRKFFELHAANQSSIAKDALEQIAPLYEVEREAKDQSPERRQALGQERSKPVFDKLKNWLIEHKRRVPDNSATARAIDYSLKRWAALVRYVDNGHMPIDNNLIERQIRPIALGCKNWLFAGSVRAGQRAAAIMSLINSAKLNGIEPHAYLKDVMQRPWPLKSSWIGQCRQLPSLRKQYFVRSSRG